MLYPPGPPPQVRRVLMPAQWRRLIITDDMAISALNLPRLGLALAALLCALCAAEAAVTCPTTGSGTTSISCYEGATYAGTVPAALMAGGLCTCKCGALGDYDYQTSTGGTTQFTATGSAACTATACSTNFPTYCAVANGGVPIAVFQTAAQMVAAQTPGSKVSGTNTICGSLTAACSVGARNPCPSYLTSGTVTQNFALKAAGPFTEAQICARLLAKPGVTVTALCTSNNCNAPAKSAAAAAMPAKALLAVAVVALAAAAL